MVERRPERQSGGVNIKDSKVDVHGDIVGRDKIVGTEVSTTQLDQIFQPLVKAVAAAPSEKQQQAEQKVVQLKSEAAKGTGADDSVMANLVDGLVKLVPSAVGAIVSAFATPILGGIAGPATKVLLDKIQNR
jgi:hypothetical protein